MKKVLLALFVTICLAGTAQAGLFEFSFDDSFTSGDVTRTLVGGDASGAISEYMTAVYGSPVTVDGAVVYPAGAVDPLFTTNSGNYIADAVQGPHQFTIEFAVPITAVSFKWARADDPFKLEVVYTDGTTAQIFSTEGSEWAGLLSGIWGIDALPLPVSTLFFHDGGKGAIGIDNLAVVSAVPLPTSMLLGVVAVGVAGRKLRRFV